MNLKVFILFVVMGELGLMGDRTSRIHGLSA